MLSKSMVKVLIAVINGSNCLESLQKELKVSKSWMSRIIDSLENQGFIRKVREGKGLRIKVAVTPHAIAFRNMYLDKPYRKYAEILSGKNLDVLLAIVSGEKSTDAIGDMMQVQARIIRPRIRFLANNGLIIKKGRRYGISKKQNEVILFLQSLRNFSKKNGIVLWKFWETALIKTNRLSDVNGMLTGFNKYADFGVQVNTIAFMYYTGVKKLSVEDIFLHSLFEVNDQRTFALAITLYAKQKLYLKKKKQKIMLLAEKFDKLDETDNVINVFEMMKNNNIKESSSFPIVDMKEIKRQFALYGVKNV